MACGPHKRTNLEVAAPVTKPAMAETKFAKGDRVQIVQKLFPSYDEGLFAGLAKTGTILEVNPGSILPYRVTIDGFEHHPFWFYENQLETETTGDDGEAEAS